MKYFKPAFLVATMVLFISCRVYSQTKSHSIVSTKTVVLTYKHTDSSYIQDHTDTLNIPVVSDSYPGLQKALAFENIGDASGVDSIKANYAACGCGLVGMNYKVTFEDKGLLSIEIYTDGMGAYPSTTTQRLTLSIATGKGYGLKNEINGAGRNWIYQTYKTLLKRRIAADYQSRKGEEDKDNLAELNGSVDTLTASAMLKDYLFTPKGIIFSTEGILPHATQAFEPDREWLVSYKQLSKYKSPQAIIVK